MAEVVNIKYKGLQPAIAEELSLYEDRYFCYDEPVPFCGLQIYPATMRNYNEFMIATACLTLNKNEKVEGIRMTHLDFLLTQTKQEGEVGKFWAARVSRLLEIVFRFENGLQCSNCQTHETYMEYIAKYQKALENKEQPEKNWCFNCSTSNLKEMVRYEKDRKTNKTRLLIGNAVITSADFDRLRQIVLFQNLPDYRDDTWVNPALKADYQARMEIQGRDQGKATLEKKFVCVAAKSGYKIHELYDLTVRKFLMLLSTVDDLINYETTRIGLMTGMVSTKNPIEHWIYKKDKDMYGDAYVSLDQYKEQAKGASA